MNINMASTAANIFVDSSQYTPVYFIEDAGVSQARSYVVSQNTTNNHKPISDNLKKFYENSGELEKKLYSENFTKPRILKKQDSNVVGNHIKVASFFKHKNESIADNNETSTTTNNIIFKPVYIANSPNIVNNVPKLDINSKIVRLKEMPNITRSISHPKLVPKIKKEEKPKENTTNSRHTSVQLLKLGETYHSLNQLSEEQMKIVNHALKIFKNPQNIPQKPTYDPVTNTKFIYKVVSPKDLTVVGKNNLLLKQKKPEVKKIVKRIEKRQETETEKESLDTKIPIFLENAVTRSGRKVKISKNILPEEIPNTNKPKRKMSASCTYCCSKFSSVSRLQRHYEFHPTHLPQKIHSSLFQCLLAIITSNSNKNSADIFIQQLEQFVMKLRACLPCLLNTDSCPEDQVSVVREDVARILGVNAGKYNLNMDGLDCVKDQNGCCQHNSAQQSKEERVWLVETNSEVSQPMDSNYERMNPMEVLTSTDINLAEKFHSTRVNSVEKKPMIKVNGNDKNALENPNMKISTVEKPTSPKRLEIRTSNDEMPNAKRLKTNPIEEVPSITTEEIIALLSDAIKTDDVTEKDHENTVLYNGEESSNTSITPKEKPKPSHIQFRSTHFDIRSSPIKSSSNTFSKFQINTENMSKYKVHIIQPLQLNDKSKDKSNLATESIFNNSTLECREYLEQIDYSKKDWSNEQTNLLLKIDNVINDEISQAIHPGLIHTNHTSEKIDSSSEANNVNKSNGLAIHDQLLINQEHSIDALNFLESLGNECIYPETERNNTVSDFHLDLFSFNNT